MQREFGITTIYVTHDQEEALTLSDRIAVFNNGFIEQIGTPNDIYNHSATDFVCNFIGDINKLPDAVAAQIPGLSQGDSHYIRLERVRVGAAAHDGCIALPGAVAGREYYGLYIKYSVDIGGTVMKVVEKNDGVNIHEPGERVTLNIAAKDVMSYPKGASA